MQINRTWLGTLASAVLLCLALPSQALAQPQMRGRASEDVVTRLQNLPPEAKRNAVKRYQHFYEQRAYPYGTIPAGALSRAKVNHIQQFGALRQEAGGQTALSLLNQWRPLGPAPIGTNPTTSGRINSIAIDPTNTNTIYIGSATGGVWKSVDGGGSWLSLTDTQCSTAMGAVAIDPSNPQVIYAGTGENNFSLDSYYGCGVLKSTNGGATWTQTGASVFDSTTGGATIAKIAIHPTVTNTVMVASSFGVYRSINGGSTYTLVLNGVGQDLVIDPANPSVMYAAIGNVSGSAVNGVYKSTNSGLSWTQLAGGLPTSNVGRINLAISASSPSTVMAVIQNSSTFGFLGLWKTTNSGATWTQQTAANASCSNQCWYDMSIAIDPTNANTVYFGGVSLFKSTDGGANFAVIGSNVHVDHHALAFQPGNPATVYAGSDGGVYRSTDSGANWVSVNGNLGITQFVGTAGIHPTNADTFLGGTQDNGTLLTTGSSVWSQPGGLNCCDGGSAGIDISNPAIAYGETQWGGGFSGPRRTDNLGVNNFVQKNVGINLGDSALFYPPMLMSRSWAQTLYFGTSKVYKSTNRGDSWTASGTSIGVRVSALADSGNDTLRVYAGTETGQVYKSTDGNATYVNVSTGLPGRYITALRVHPTNQDTVFATVSGFGTGHVWKTTNGGSSWTDISGNLPDVPVNSIVLDPVSPVNDILVGTDLGVYRTTNGGSSWVPFTAGLPNVPVVDLQYNATTDVLVASTHGRGMWRASLGGAQTRTTSRDFNGDRRSDILWRNTVTGDAAIWLMGSSLGIGASGVPGSATSDWVIQGSGDFDGDGKSDVLWRNTTSGQVVVWFMNGLSVTGTGSPGGATTDWVVQGAWDFNGDGRSDILWRNSTSGQLIVWTMNATATSVTGGGSPGSTTTDWVVQAGGDFNLDGKADIVWRNSTSGQVIIWYMDGATLIGNGSPGGASLDWVIEGTGDFNLDGRSDLFWRNSLSGQTAVWLMNGNSILSSAVPGSATTDWTVQRVGDFVGANAKSDVLWRNTTTGQVVIWVLDGTALVGSGSIGGASNDWVIQKNKD